MIGIAGRANELIAIETLLARGLERETAFEDVAASNREEDIRVYTEVANGESLQVEVKSTGLRERGDAGAARIEDPSVLFGFFDDVTEVMGRADALEKHAVAVYLPPATLNEMREKNRAVYEMNSTHTEQLFFRANNTFPGDMEYYHSHGTLPERDCGHEQSLLD